MSAPIVDLGQVQADVLRGFRTTDALHYAHFSLIRFASQSAARTWLQSLVPKVTTCASWDSTPSAQRTVINVAFTYPGLLLITGQPPPSGPPPSADPNSGHGAFVEGAIARSNRTPAFGDVGGSAPSNWETPFQQAWHALVSVSADTQPGLATALGTVPPAGAGAVIHTETGGRLPNNEEHFGFADGIGQPDVEGIGLLSEPGGGTPVETTAGPTWKPIPPGEFVLGYPDAAGETLGAHPLTRNGSFLVFRKLAQEVFAFRQVGKDFGNDNLVSPDWLLERIVGRHRNGDPLVPFSSNPNNFRFANDEQGFGCPFGAHVRRANPRDDKTGPTASQVERRRMIRRGLPYGPPLPATATADDGVARGLLFLAINADIERQFEFVQANWINSTLSSAKLTIDADKDPLLGANVKSGSKFVVQNATKPELVFGLDRFVTVKGGAYFFLPSLLALGMLASGAAIVPSWPFYPPPP